MSIPGGGLTTRYKPWTELLRPLGAIVSEVNLPSNQGASLVFISYTGYVELSRSKRETTHSMVHTMDLITLFMPVVWARFSKRCGSANGYLSQRRGQMRAEWTWPEEFLRISETITCNDKILTIGYP